MRLFWTSEALEDRDTIYDYLEARNPLAALDLDELFSEQARLLEDHPALGRIGKKQGTRELIVHSSYYLVYDVVENDSVRVLRVLHAKRQWPSVDA